MSDEPLWYVQMLDALRARLAECERERDAARLHFKVVNNSCEARGRKLKQAEAERDAAIQRAERAEADLARLDEHRHDADRIIAFVNAQVTAYAVAGDVLRASLLAAIADALEHGAWRGKEQA